MSMLRNIAKIFLGFLFTMSLVSTIVIYSLVSFTEYENVKSIILDILKQRQATFPIVLDESQNLLIAEDIYYKKYDCDLLTCINSGEQIMPLLITQHANNFYKSILNYAIIITIVLGGIFVFLAQGIKSKLKSLGFSLLWSSVPFIVLSFFMENLVASFTTPNLVSIVQPVIQNFFSPTFFIYLYIMIAGICLVVAGYLIKTKPTIFGNIK